ncbi:hypothetical protein GCM10010387_15390 [Streptomyces inusitatus]|uniref:Minor tail protein n=1 Tax=Streptomyces inusitatus TaxID=68221 RepID=A0A918PV54_9ACTN|nr:hypothetical protein [Streptomyces inusitatus]GGZ23204.1 hypothetical protein GCM10010387_15390 [Streptomyces inusitatus]
MTVAGCGSHTARIIDRDGGTVSQADILVEVEWSRLLDDTSTARILVQPEGDCCEQLGRVRAWRHTLAIYREGMLVWTGPIVRVEWGLGRVEVFASDISVWLDRRVPHDSMTFTDVDLTRIAEWLITDAFAPDDPGHTVTVVGLARVHGSRSYIKEVGQSGDHLRDLAETGIDYTVVGANILLLPEDHQASVGRLSDADFPEGLVVAEDGASLATRWIVAGDDEGDVLGTAGGSHAYYGLLEQYLEQTAITDDASAEQAARAKLRASLPVPVFVDSQEVTISPQAAVDVATLVPGWCLDITSALTCRTVTQRLKITGVRVEEDGGTDDDPGAERIQVQVAVTGAEGS